MPYTLSMGLLWFGLALVVGLVLGVALRSVTARRQVADARSGATDRAELDRLRERVSELESALDAALATATDLAGGVTDEPQVEAGVEVDDLTVVEGLGPGVRELCHGIGILTWADLAETEPSLLRTMLDDAGARFQVHDPTTWPAQARLLAERRWDEFEALAAEVRSAPPTGRTP